MSRLRDQLASPTDEARISRMWASIRARRERRPPYALGAIALGLAVAATAIVVAWPTEPAPPAPAPIALASGGAPDRLEAHAVARTVALDDGSTIELARDTRIEVMENRGEQLSLLLVRGRARFAVRPHGPRRWTIESGLATVDVVGTVFRVERAEDGVRVAVERGVVLVRGERVPDRVVRLTADDSLFVEAPRPEPAVVVAPIEPPVAVAPERRARRAPRDRVPRGRVEVAWAAPEASSDADELLAHAERAEREGDARTQAALLRRVSALEDDPRAAMAAFTLGRIEMDRLRRPREARAALERAIALGLPARLEEQARARLRTLGARLPAFE